MLLHDHEATTDDHTSSLTLLHMAWLPVLSVVTTSYYLGYSQCWLMKTESCWKSSNVFSMRMLPSMYCMLARLLPHSQHSWLTDPLHDGIMDHMQTRLCCNATMHLRAVSMPVIVLCSHRISHRATFIGRGHTRVSASWVDEGITREWNCKMENLLRASWGADECIHMACHLNHGTMVRTVRASF